MQCATLSTDAFHFPGDKAQKRWTNIRDVFRAYRTKVGKSHKSGLAAKFVKPYKYAALLEFMIPELSTRK